MIILIGLYIIEFTAHILNHNYPFLFTQTKLTDIVVLFIFIYIVSFSSTKIRLFLISGILLFTLMQITHYQYFGAYIQPISFHLLLIHAREIGSVFLKEVHTVVLSGIGVILLGIALYFSTRKVGKKVTISKRAPKLLLLLLITNTILTYFVLNHNPGKLYHWEAKLVMPTTSSPAFINTFRSLTYYLVGIIPKKIFGNISMFPELPQPVIQTTKPDINVILIIGESLRAKQLTILGYKTHNTTPNLSQIKGLRAKTIYSAGTMTKTSVAGIINRLKYPGVSTQIASQSNNLFRMAKENGFTTHFISGQPGEDCVILENLIGKKSIDYFMTRSDFKKGCSKYDIAFIDYLNGIDFHQSNFIVLQQSGSHIPYPDQYPKSFNRFKSAYDNSVLYTDYVISEVMKQIQSKSKKPTYIIFTSDHGQMVHEEGLYGHGWFKKPVYRVPLMLLTMNTQDHDTFNYFDHIQSHFDMSTLVGKLLGYKLNVDQNSDKEIFVNGSDIDGLAGYLHLKLKGDTLTSSKIIR